MVDGNRKPGQRNARRPEPLRAGQRGLRALAAWPLGAGGPRLRTAGRRRPTGLAPCAGSPDHGRGPGHLRPGRAPCANWSIGRCADESMDRDPTMLVWKEMECPSGTPPRSQLAGQPRPEPSSRRGWGESSFDPGRLDAGRSRAPAVASQRRPLALVRIVRRADAAVGRRRSRCRAAGRRARQASPAAPPPIRRLVLRETLRDARCARHTVVARVQRRRRERRGRWRTTRCAARGQATGPAEPRRMKMSDSGRSSATGLDARRR